MNATKSLLEGGKGLGNLDIIVNKKTIDGVALIQLETAIGAAIQCFKNSCAINVPRTRFLPVKSTNELLLVQSNLYTCVNGILTMNPARPFVEAPEIKLGEHMKKVGEYSRHLPVLPNLLELVSLTVCGDVSFGKAVTLKGTVIIVAPHGTRVHIPDNKELENVVVIGSSDDGKFTVVPHN